MTTKKGKSVIDWESAADSSIPTVLHSRGEDFVLEGDEVDIVSVFLCGVMWCGHRHEEADTQLLRATLSRDPGPRCSFLRLDQNHP